MTYPLSGPEADSSHEEVLDPRVAEVLNPEETAIIVVDVMDAYCDPEAPLPRHLRETEGLTVEHMDAVADAIVVFLAASRQYPMAATVFTRMAERPETSPPSIRLKMEVDGSPPVAEENGIGWNYYRVNPQPGDYQLKKPNYDAFLGTELDHYLRARGVKTTIIIGGWTSVCIDTTARTSAQLGYNTLVPADLIAGPELPGSPQTPETTRRQLSTISEVMGYMPLAKTILGVWEQSGADPT